LHRWIALVKALLLSRNNLPGFFRFREIRKKPKNPYFWLPQQKMGSMAGTFTIPEFNSSYTITDSNLVRIGDKNFFEENHVPPPFYLIFTSENHLNAHSSLIEHNMTMNSTPLDSSQLFDWLKFLEGNSLPKQVIYHQFSQTQNFLRRIFEVLNDQIKATIAKARLQFTQT
jgi:hypothetical protein